MKKLISTLSVILGLFSNLAFATDYVYIKFNQDKEHGNDVQQISIEPDLSSVALHPDQGEIKKISGEKRKSDLRIGVDHKDIKNYAPLDYIMEGRLRNGGFIIYGNSEGVYKGAQHTNWIFNSRMKINNSYVKGDVIIEQQFFNDPFEHHPWNIGNNNPKYKCLETEKGELFELTRKHDGATHDFKVTKVQSCNKLSNTIDHDYSPYDS
ncbi:hypothetical protein OAO18_05995 [Francisellaceae bacterium]|nr:hypothetical protein [Francisellaceae bacterium]